VAEVIDRRRQRLTLYAMCIAQGMILLDITIVNVALPAIQKELHTSAASLEWVVSAYALTLATLIPLCGSLGDRYGRKRLFLAGLAVFTAASALCAVSSSDTELIAFRVLQGVGGAAMSALTLSILSEAYAERERARAIGIWAAMAGLGFGLGPVIGGVLIALFDWTSVFWVNVPIGAGAFVIAAIGVRESRDPAQRALDPVGVVLSAAGLFGVTLGFVEAANRSLRAPLVYVPIAAGAVLLLAFAWWERRARSPMVPRGIVADRGFDGAAAIYFLAYLALASVMFFVTLLFQDVKGWSSLRTGLSWLAMNVPFLVMAPLSGRLQGRFERRSIVITGCVVAAAGVFVLGLVTATSPFILAALGYLALGAGYGTLVPATTSVAMRTLPTGTSGVASGILNTSRQVGTAVGLGVVAFIGVSAAQHAWTASIPTLPPASRADAAGLTSSVGSGNVHAVATELGSSSEGIAASAFLHGYRVAVFTCAGALLLSALVALGLLRPRPAPVASTAAAR
jgi:EmrB/QacA subfamily drug resistance transporter